MQPKPCPTCKNGGRIVIESATSAVPKWASYTICCEQWEPGEPYEFGYTPEDAIANWNAMLEDLEVGRAICFTCRGQGGACCGGKGTLIVSA